MNFVKIKIEGNFLDSFLYSGILFTIDTNGNIYTHSFKHLINNFAETLDSSKEKWLCCTNLSVKGFSAI